MAAPSLGLSVRFLDCQPAPHSQHSFYAFTEHYQKWCKRKGYNFQPNKPVEIYEPVRNIIPVLPKNEVTKFIVRQAEN